MLSKPLPNTLKSLEKIADACKQNEARNKKIEDKDDKNKKKKKADL